MLETLALSLSGNVPFANDPEVFSAVTQYPYFF